MRKTIARLVLTAVLLASSLGLGACASTKKAEPQTLVPNAPERSATGIDSQTRD